MFPNFLMNRFYVIYELSFPTCGILTESTLMILDFAVDGFDMNSKITF
jgi:hypothetical protein